MAAAESEIAAKLIERLLADPAFRDRFRRDPAVACREAGLDSLAEEMQLGAGKAMHTLDIRESRSSLAGVMMAAAMEGMGVYEFSQHVVPHLEDLSGAVGDVLSRVNLPALPGARRARGRAGGERGGVTAPPARRRGGDRRCGRRRRGGRGAGARGGAAPPAPEEAAPSAGAEAGGRRPARPGAKAAGDAAAGGRGGDRGGAGADERRRDGAGGARARGARRRGAAPRRHADAASTSPAARSCRPGTSSRRRPRAGPSPAAQQDPPAAAARRPRRAAGVVAAGGPVPARAGGDGRQARRGGARAAENKNVVLDDVGVADIKAGRIDPRIVGVLTKLSQEHKIVVSCMCSDHPKFTTGGSVSNHTFGRGLDIASIDGEIVSPGSALAREVASELSEFDPASRPDEIGSPFAINGPGYFTDAAHQNHIHVGFKTEITPDFKLPADVSATAAPAAPAVAAPVAGAPAAAAAAAPEVAAIAAAGGRRRGRRACSARMPEPGKVAPAGAAAARRAIRSCSCRRSPPAAAGATAAAAAAAGRSGGGRSDRCAGRLPGR